MTRIRSLMTSNALARSITYSAIIVSARLGTCHDRRLPLSRTLSLSFVFISIVTLSQETYPPLLAPHALSISLSYSRINDLVSHSRSLNGPFCLITLSSSSATAIIFIAIIVVSHCLGIV